MDHDERIRVAFVADSKDSTTADKFVWVLTAPQGNRSRIGIVTCDMALWLKTGLDRNLQRRAQAIGKFYVTKQYTDAIEQQSMSMKTKYFMVDES